MEKYEEKVKKEFENLTNTQRLLFGACCIDRILHLIAGFDYFLEENHIKRITKEPYLSLCTDWLDSIFLYVNINKDISPDEIEKTLNILNEIIPDTEEFSDNVVIFTQNSMIGLSYLYEFINKNELIFITNCSDKVIETIDVMYYETDYERLDIHYEEDYKIQFNCIEMIKAGKDITELRKYNQLTRVNNKT
ncbi:hypothetical protein L0M85_03115 [Streptococcus sp. DFI.7.26]|uniref:hypothetical protein n=1 Tax=Streptococcus TaxID=1301 RepID=UPI001EE78C76|nr:hypothetical protein [Streptococcus sp. DFI.7.26]MCG5641800.1 hypothetical protein [Streptococcus sp. DFI.7.26]